MMMLRTALIGLALAAFAHAGDREEHLKTVRKAMFVHIKVGDQLKRKGQLDAAVREYQRAIAIYEKAMAAPKREPAPAPKVVPAKKVVPAPVVKPKLTQERRQALTRKYIAVLQKNAATVQERYNATVQLGDLEQPEAVPVLIQALTADKNNLVQRAAAWSLGRFGKRGGPAMPLLIYRIGTGDPYVAYMSERALAQITKAVLGEPVSMGFDPTMNAKQRKETHAKWTEWWAANRAKFEAE